MRPGGNWEISFDHRFRRLRAITGDYGDVERFTLTGSPAKDDPASSARKRTRPLATARPAASVTVASQTRVRRPRINGRAVARNFPSRTAFRNDVWFSRPTTDCPRGNAASAAPTEATVSISPEYTPPWT